MIYNIYFAFFQATILILTILQHTLKKPMIPFSEWIIRMVLGPNLTMIVVVVISG